MRIVLADVISLDGKISKGDGGLVREWASPEDGTFLTQLIKQFEVVVLGRVTYELLRTGLHKNRLYIVLTHHPEKFADQTVPGQREFIAADPAELAAHCQKRGYKSMLLLTGSSISTAFLRAGLVNELYLTIEPLLLGSGQSMVDPVTLTIACRLDSVTTLNTQGTLLAHYFVGEPPLDS